MATLCLYFAFKQVNLEDINRAISDANIYFRIFKTFLKFDEISWIRIFAETEGNEVGYFKSPPEGGFFWNSEPSNEKKQKSQTLGFGKELHQE